MRSAGSDADEHVTCCHVLHPRQHLGALNRADDKTRQIVMPWRIHAWHFSGLAANQGAARLFAAFSNAGNDTFRDPAFQLPGCKIVQEKQRLSALGEDIIGAHGDEIDPDRVMDPGFKGEHEFCPDAISARNQDWILPAVFLQIEQGAKTTQTPHDACTSRGFCQRADRFDQVIACLNIDTCVAISQGIRCVTCHGCAR